VLVPEEAAVVSDVTGVVVAELVAVVAPCVSEAGADAVTAATVGSVFENARCAATGTLEVASVYV